jgi:hypothetical protein
MTFPIDANVQRLLEAARYADFPEQATTSTATSAKASAASPAAQIPDDVLRQLLDALRASNIQTGNLANLGEKLDASLIAKVKDAGARFEQNNFGQVVNSAPSDVLGGLRSQATTATRNPLPTQVSQLMTGRDEMLSDDPPADTDKKGASKVSVKDGLLAAASEFLGDIGGFAFSVLTSNTDSPGDKLNEFNGFKALLQSRQTGSTNQQAGDYKLNDAASWDGTRTPLPDDVSNSGGPVIVTKQLLDALKALKNSASQPTGDEQSSGGGQINTGANGTGRQGSLSQPVPDGDAYQRVAVTGAALTALQVRIQSKITTIR